MTHASHTYMYMYLINILGYQFMHQIDQSHLGSSRENLSSRFATKRISNQSSQLQRLDRTLEFSPVVSNICYFPKYEEQRR